MINFFLKIKSWKLFLWVVFIPILMYAWLYSITVGLNKKIPETLKLKLHFFKFCLSFYLSYTILLLIAVATILIKQIDPGPIFLLIIPFHLFAMFAIFYSVYCAGKALEIAESQNAPSPERLFLNFILIAFYPIGIWFIQPKVNKLSL